MTMMTINTKQAMDEISAMFQTPLITPQSKLNNNNNNNNNNSTSFSLSPSPQQVSKNIPSARQVIIIMNEISRKFLIVLY